MRDNHLTSVLEDDKRRIAAVSIFSHQQGNENGHLWSVMAAFEAGPALLLNGQAESLVQTTLCPPDERTEWEFVGLIHCSPKELNEWASSGTYTPPAPEQWAMDCAKEAINRFQTSKEEDPIDLLRLRDPALLSNLTGRSKDLIEMGSRDTWQRPANVYIYSRLLRGSNDSSGSSDLLGSFVDAGGIFRHWGVIVDFGNGKAFTFDGNTRNSANIVSGDFIVWVTPGWPDPSPASQQATELIGEVECSPKEMFELARELFNIVPQYDLFMTNCQTWAVHFSEWLVSRFGGRQKAKTTLMSPEGGKSDVKTLRDVIPIILGITGLLIVTVVSSIDESLTLEILVVVLILLEILSNHLIYVALFNSVQNILQGEVSLLMTTTALLVEYFITRLVPSWSGAYTIIAILLSVAYAAGVVPNWFVIPCVITSYFLGPIWFILLVPCPSIILWITTAGMIGLAYATNVSSNWFVGFFSGWFFIYALLETLELWGLD